jgi:tight adherence protein C
MALLLSFVVAAGLALATVGVLRSRQPATDPESFLRSLDDSREVDQFEERLQDPFVTRVLKPISGSLLGGIGKLTPVAQRDRVRSQLTQAGLTATLRAEDFLAIQILTTVVGVVIGLAYLGFGSGSATLRFLTAIILIAAGFLGPQAWLTRKVDARKQQIFLDLPDVLDLLAISVEAGVGFEGAMAIVCEHFQSPLAEEFSRTLKEMELGLPRREALQNLKRRTEVPDLSNFVLALVQADALGMPIGRVLHTQAIEMRSKRRQWAREKAGKLPVKILFPLVLFIFPAVLIVLIGPAASTIGHAFSH